MKKKKDSDNKNTDSKNKSIKLPSIKEEKTTKDSSGSSSKSRSKVKIKQEPLPSPKKEEDKSMSTDDDKKPIGIPVEAINIESYTAVDPLTVAQELKEDETVELSAMTELRNKNKQKLIDENLEGPYCLCRKGIDGFMIRCNLCFNWYHTSCICPPKTVHGKSIGKGYNSWSASREVHYLCTLCCRSRRPRLDNILQLLMSLQKLPVRVPEGEALQFLTERAMNWQDRAKKALEDVEIARILTEARSQAEKLIAEKQAAVPNSAGHSGTQLNIIFYQKLLMVKKVHTEKKLESKPSVSEIAPADVEMTATTNTASDSTERVTLKEEATIQAVTATSPMKTDQLLTTPLVTTSDKHRGDELPADLECTEEMSTGSPEASKSTSASNPSTSDPNVVRIHSESSSRAQSPIDVCTPLDSLTTASLEPSSPSSSQPLPPTTTTAAAVRSVASSLPKATLTMHELDTALLDQLEELMFEGELLEVGLDEVQQIWAILQIQRPLSKDACNVMVRDFFFFFSFLL